MASRPVVAPPALEVRNLSKSFEAQKALDGVDIRIGDGEIHGLVGVNGSGKSTLVKVLAGYHAPDPGATATLRGVPFPLGSAAAAQRAGVRFVHQDLALLEPLAATENIALGGAGFRRGRFGRIRWRAQHDEAQALVESLGYSFDVRRAVSGLSAVERTAVAIARSLQAWEDSVSVLVLDEPTASLPAHAADRLLETVRRVAARGVAVVFVSHRLGEILDVAERVTVLRDGRCVVTRDADDLSHDSLVRFITGRATAELAVSAPRAPRDDVVLSARGLCGHTVSALDLDVHAGEVTGIAGLDGSGRDELCSLLFGALARGGTVAVDGAPVRGDRPDLSMGAGVAFLPADRKRLAAAPPLTGAENLVLADLRPLWRRLRLSASAERREVATWWERLSIRPADPSLEFGNYSGGNQQKIVLAKWLRRAPRVLLLDEPTQGVDVGTKAEIHRLVDLAAAEGAAVVVSSSENEELVRLCDRVLVMAGGKAVDDLSGRPLDAGRITEAMVAGGVGQAGARS